MGVTLRVRAETQQLGPGVPARSIPYVYIPDFLCLRVGLYPFAVGVCVGWCVSQIGDLV